MLNNWEPLKEKDYMKEKEYLKKTKRDQGSQDEWCHRTQEKNIFETLSG